MINALIQGRIVHSRMEGDVLVGRIVLDGEKPIQFTARRAAVKSALLAMPTGMPLSAAGTLNNRVKHESDGSAYVCNELLITAVLTAQPKGLFGSIF